MALALLEQGTSNVTLKSRHDQRDGDIEAIMRIGAHPWEKTKRRSLGRFQFRLAHERSTDLGELFKRSHKYSQISPEPNSSSPGMLTVEFGSLGKGKVSNWQVSTSWSISGP